MARSLRQEIFAAPATGMDDGNHSTGRSGLYMLAYINDQFIGGLESFSFDENTGVTFRRQIGNSWNEPEPNPYDISGSFTRFQIRGKTLRQIMATIFPTVSWIDYRQLGVHLNIHQFYQSASGRGPSATQGSYENTWTELQDVWFTRVSESQPNETGNRTETVQFVARGVIEQGDNITSLAPDSHLIGS